jgi:hypothetical protein
MTSTTFVDNSSIIYASWLNDVNSAVYNGTFISSTITPTNIVCNGLVSGTGFSGLVNSALGSPAAIGNGTPNTGAFTTLTLTNALGVSYGGTGTTTSTGSGATVRATSPTLLSPLIAGATSGAITLASPAVAGTNTITLPAQTGTVMVNGPAFSAYNNSTQTLPITTLTKVILNTKSYDTNSNFDNVTNYRFTPTVAGYYLFTAQVYNGTQVTLLPEIYKNGAAVAFGTLTAPSSSNGNNGANVSTILFMNGSTDYVELYVASIAVASTLAAGPNANYFTGAMIRGA